MSTITEEYRRLNAELHERRPDYGVSSSKWAGHVAELAKNLEAFSILDYGCGKGMLGKALSHMIVKNYDPAIPGLDAPPDPADLVVCTDVLEHIEPDLLDNVLDDLQRCSIKGVFLTIATRPAKKVLADGRNAHLIQKPSEWWLPKLWSRWDLMMFQLGAGEFAVVMTAKPEAMRVAA